MGITRTPSNGNKRRKPTANGTKLLLRAVLFSLVIGAGIAAGYIYLTSLNHTTPSSAVHQEVRHPLPQPSSSSSQHAMSIPTKNGALVVPRPGLKLAILIDDMGRSTAQIQRLIALQVPLSIAIIPGLAQDKAVATAAHTAGLQILVHLPMEALPGSYERLENNGLLTSMQDQEIITRVIGYCQRIPYAVGANNHMGSAFTQNAQKMDTVLRTLKERHFFFIDSVTTPKSVALKQARACGVPTARRDIFLDNDQNDIQIRTQMAKALRIATKNGSALIIGHPHTQTLNSLERIIPELSKQGVVFVRVGDLTR